MKEQFIVTRAVFNFQEETFIVINPNGKDAPPTFDTYGYATQWIEKHGEKAKFYQIQKILMPV